MIQIKMSEEKLDKISNDLFYILCSHELTAKEMVAVLGYSACCLITSKGIHGIEVLGSDFMESVEEHLKISREKLEDKELE